VARLRYIGWAEYGRLVERLARLVEARGVRFDLVIGIARGGVPVAMVVSDRLGAKVDFINVKSYTGLGSRTKPRILATITEEIGGKQVLIVDDIIDEGDTMKTVKEYLSNMKPATMETAVLFTKPWSPIDPDYSLQGTKSWIVFPYERGEVKRLSRRESGRRHFPER
jgi:hypoxanthine phosphoribosyltransferase